MAKIGLLYPVYKGSTGGVIGKALTADVTIEKNNAELYADDAIAESDYSFKSGTISLGVDELSDAVQAELLGHVITSGEMVASTADAPAYVGVGFYRVKRVNGALKYTATFYPKVMFSEPQESDKTHGESTEFGTYALEGKILPYSDGKWKKTKTFDLVADAIAYLNTLVGLAVVASAGLSALAMTGTGGTLSPAFGAAVRFYTFGGVTAASVTVTPTAAAHTIKLYVDDVYVQDVVSGSPSAAIAMAIGSKKIKLVAYEAGKSSQTTEIVVVKIS